jgi:hypothetical protein
VDNNICNRLNHWLTMLCVVEGLPLEDKVVEVLAHAAAIMVVVAVTVVHRTNFLQCQLCGCTNISVFKCYKRFDPKVSKGKRRVPTPLHPMVSTPTGMQTPVPWTMSLMT